MQVHVSPRRDQGEGVGAGPSRKPRRGQEQGGGAGPSREPRRGQERGGGAVPSREPRRDQEQEGGSGLSQKVGESFTGPGEIKRRQVELGCHREMDSPSVVPQQLLFGQSL